MHLRMSVPYRRNQIIICTQIYQNQVASMAIIHDLQTIDSDNNWRVPLSNHPTPYAYFVPFSDSH